MLIKYIILAIIQGITEPLPISSSGHLMLFKSVFNVNMPNDLNFEIICNFGSFIGILTIFRKDIINLLKSSISFLKKQKRFQNAFNYLVNIFISTIPVCITGLLFKNTVEKSLDNHIYLAFSFLITALALFFVRKHSGIKEDYQISKKDAIIIGLFQSITILPGISRSGTVLVACLLCHIKKEAALKYTFMLYFPVSIASLFLGLNDLVNTPYLNNFLIPYLISIIISGIITYLSYNWLSNWVKRGKLHYFAIYALLVSLFILYFFR